MCADVAAAGEPSRCAGPGRSASCPPAGRDAARARAHRAPPERRRARLPGRRGGTHRRRAERGERACTSLVLDDGAGLPEGFDLAASPGSVCRSCARWSTASCAARSSSSPRRGPRHAGRARGAAAPPELRRPWRAVGPTRRCRPAPGRADNARRARAARLSARRSSSLVAPQTPASCPVSSAHVRHGSTTGQRWQTSLASSTWVAAGRPSRSGRTARGPRRGRARVAPVHAVQLLGPRPRALARRPHVPERILRASLVTWCPAPRPRPPGSPGQTGRAPFSQAAQPCTGGTALARAAPAGVPLSSVGSITSGRDASRRLCPE